MATTRAMSKTRAAKAGMAGGFVARCAAVSYERQRAEKSVEEYVARHDALKASGHWSPFEHQAKVASEEEIREHAYFKWNGASEEFVATTIGGGATSVT